MEPITQTSGSNQTQQPTQKGGAPTVADLDRKIAEQDRESSAMIGRLQGAGFKFPPPTMVNENHSIVVVNTAAGDETARMETKLIRATNEGSIYRVAGLVTIHRGTPQAQTRNIDPIDYFQSAPKNGEQYTDVESRTHHLGLIKIRNEQMRTIVEALVPSKVGAVGESDSPLTAPNFPRRPAERP